MILQTLKVLGVLSLVTTPCVAQFGIGKKRQGTSFQDLQERAAAAAGDAGPDSATAAAGDLADLTKLQDMFADAFADPQAMAGFNDEMAKALKQLEEMDPQDLQRQMEETLQAMTQGDVMESIIGQKDAVLANLEETGLVSKEELEKYRNDPAYFEAQMRDAFGQMKEVFADPEVLKMAGETMQNMQQAMTDPAIVDLTKMLEEGLHDDTKIEEVRLKLLSDPELAENPLFKGLFDGDDDQSVLHDPQKWRDSVKEGQEMLAGAGMAGGSAAGGGAAGRVGHGEL